MLFNKFNLMSQVSIGTAKLHTPESNDNEPV